MRLNLRHILIPVFLGVLPYLYGQKTALLLIDIQDFYFPGGRVQLEDPEAAGTNAGLVLDFFRKQGLGVIHVRHNSQPGGAIHRYVRPEKGEPVISKDHVNAFLDTGLEEVLREHRYSRLVICGMQTHMCVEAAVRAAHDRGYECILVSDACATRAIQHEEHIIPASHVHLSTLQSLGGTYATVVTTDELLREFQSIIIKELE